jgi:hypothetical protein
MTNIPDWVWQGIAINLGSDALIAAILLAWKYRNKVWHSNTLVFRSKKYEQVFLLKY